MGLWKPSAFLCGTTPSVLLSSRSNCVLPLVYSHETDPEVASVPVFNDLGGSPAP